MAPFLVLILAANMCHALYHSTTGGQRSVDERASSTLLLFWTAFALGVYVWTVTQ